MPEVKLRESNTGGWMKSKEQEGKRVVHEKIEADAEISLRSFTNRFVFPVTQLVIYFEVIYCCKLTTFLIAITGLCGNTGNYAIIT